MDKKKKILIGVGLLVVVAGVTYYGYKKGLWLQKKEVAPAPLTAENLPAPNLSINGSGGLRIPTSATRATIERRTR